MGLDEEFEKIDSKYRKIMNSDNGCAYFKIGFGAVSVLTGFGLGIYKATQGVDVASLYHLTLGTLGLYFIWDGFGDLGKSQNLSRAFSELEKAIRKKGD